MKKIYKISITLILTLGIGLFTYSYFNSNADDSTNTIGIYNSGFYNTDTYIKWDDGNSNHQETQFIHQKGFSDSRNVNIPSDVKSIHVLIYEMWTNRKLYDYTITNDNKNSYCFHSYGGFLTPGVDMYSKIDPGRKTENYFDYFCR